MSDKIKILHVIGKRPKGGVGTFLINMHSNIDTTKVEFDYLINASIEEEGYFDNIVSSLGANVFILPELKYENVFRYLKELNNFFKQHNDYKAIHLHTANIGIFTFAMAKKYGLKHRILHSHNTKYSDKKFNSIRNFIMQLPVKKMANVYFACSKKAGRFLFGANNLDKGKIFIAKNAINAEVYRYNPVKREQVRKELSLEGKFVIGHVGRFNLQKNHDFLIETFRKIREINEHTVLVLVGGGELEEQIKTKVEQLNLQNHVRFLGIRNDVPDLLQSFDIFVLPSLFEGLPLVGIEVQAAGLPCVMSDTITEEIKITNIIDFVNLNEGPEYWAKKILESKGTERKDAYNYIVEAGYDTKQAALTLENYYIKLN